MKGVRLYVIYLQLEYLFMGYSCAGFQIPGLSFVRNSCCRRGHLSHNEHHYDTNNRVSTEPTITRIFTGSDGQSHFENVSLHMQAFVDTEGAHGWATEMQSNRGIVFRTSPPGYSLSWHTAPRRQYVIQLQGEVEIEVASGQTVTMRPGDVLLADDLTGQGHCTRVVGNITRFYAVIPLDSGDDVTTCGSM